MKQNTNYFDQYDPASIYKKAITENLKEVLNVEEAANFLSVSPQLLNTWRCINPKFSGDPKFFKIGRLVRYRRSALLDFLEEKEKSSH